MVLGATALGLGSVAPGVRALCAVLACLAAGALALGEQLDVAARARPRAPVEADVEGRVRERVRGPGWTRVDLGDASTVGPGHLRAPARLRILGRPTPPGVEALEDATPGAWIRARVRLHDPRDRHNPGARRRARALAREGIGAHAGLVHPALHARLVEREGWRPLAGLHRLRARLAARLVAAGRGGGLLAALALGDRSGLSTRTREVFARLGIAHLLAVSGLHLGLVAGLAFAALRAVLRRSAMLAMRRDTRQLALAGAVASALAYGLLAGWGVPVRRALVLLLAAALAVARARPGRRGEPLAVAALAILAFEPHALFQVGPQLSFAATAALLLAARTKRAPAAHRARRVGLALVDALRASAAAVAATAPIAACQLGSVAPFALVANLVAIPWTACALLPASLASALATACGDGPLSAAIVGLAERVAAASVAGAAALDARLPDAGVRAPPATAWLAAAGALAGLAIAARPTLLRVALAGAVGALLAVAPPPPIVPPAPRVVSLDVGQGDATLVQGREGAVLVDAGTALPGGPDLGRSAVVPALRALGVGRLDLLIASHADLDHRGGLPAVLAALPVGAVWVPLGAGAEPAFDPLFGAARARRVAVWERGLGSPSRRFGDLEVTALWPPPASAGGSRNDRSLVLRIEVDGRRVLLPGDLEATAEAALVASGVDLRADVLKLAHHGSRTSSTHAFLEAVGAGVAIVSAPERSRFGMPHGAVRARVARAQASLWWTGRDGAVLVGLGDPLWARGFADGRE